MQQQVNSSKRWTMGQGVVGLVASLCLLLAACQPLAVPVDSANSTQSGTETELPAATTAPAQEESRAMINLSAVQQILADRAKDELATELGISADDVVVTEVQSRDWPDSSLGCPEDGMMYAQVLTSGYLFMLEADGTTYEFHTADREDSPLARCNG